MSGETDLERNPHAKLKMNPGRRNMSNGNGRLTGDVAFVMPQRLGFGAKLLMEID